MATLAALVPFERPFGTPRSGTDRPLPTRLVAGSFALGAPAHRSASGIPPLRTRGSGVDAPDAGIDYLTHAIYFVPRDRPDEGLDTNGTISRSLESMRQWFRAQMGRAPRMDRSGNDYDITFVSGDGDAASYTQLSNISDELKRKFYATPNKRYLIYAAVDEGNVCGEGEYPLVPGTFGYYAAIYLDSTQGCGGRDFGFGSVANSGRTETIGVHEWLHLEGIEPLLAPHHCLTSPYHVCTGPLWLVAGADPEEPDVVFPVINARLSQKVLDRDHDDYLDHPWPHIPNLRDSLWLE